VATVFKRSFISSASSILRDLTRGLVSQDISVFVKRVLMLSN
jgi:hypothetical protein